MPSRFLIPTVLWYGLPPAAAGVATAEGTPKLATDWGGAMGREEDVRAVLLTLEPVLLLLTLAGYEIPEVAIGIAGGGDGPTAAEDLAVVWLETMEVERGTTRPWVASLQPGVVGLWLEPRHPIAAPTAAPGGTLALDVVADDFEAEEIDVPRADAGEAWLRLAWAPQSDESWPEDLTVLGQRLADRLAGELVVQREVALAAADDDAAPLCGLLGAYDSRTWLMPAQEDPDEPVTAYAAAFGDRLAALVDGEDFRPFLDSERLPAPEAGGERAPSLESRLLDGATDDVRLEIVDELAFLATELEVQTYDEDLTDERALTFGETAVLSMEQLTVTEALLYWQDIGVLDFMTSIESAVTEAFGTERYGGWALRKDDQDSLDKYEGQVRAVDIPGAGVRGWVAQLRADLATLGFGPQFGYRANEGLEATFDIDLERAVREFQIAAAAPGGARYEARVDEPTPFYADHLVGIDNPDRYEGPISGVVNDRTRALIGAWLDDDLRCPVVIEARIADGAGDFRLPHPAADSDNLWKPGQLASDVPRMFARDFSQRWVLPAGSPRNLAEFTCGDWTDAGELGTGPRGDIVSNTPWSECEVTPNTLIGLDAATLDGPTASTFRAVRAVAEVECQGFFDCAQCWDTGVLSVGLCHWTMGARGAGEAELPAYFAYLRGLGGVDAAAFESVFGAFGCSPVKTWSAGTSQTGTACWDSKERKYTSWIALAGDDGAPVVTTPVGNDDVDEWFRHWHWMLRVAMATRTVEPLRRRMWDMARFRLRDILWGPFPRAIVFQRDDGTAARATFGDVFTSERGVALVLRWHVNAPSHLFHSRFERFSDVYDAARRAVPGDWGDPPDWTDAIEAALCAALVAEGVTANDSLRTTLPVVDGWNRPYDGPDDEPHWEHHDYWALDYDAIGNTPRLEAPANTTTPAGQPLTIAVAVDFRHVLPDFEPTIRCVVGPGPVATAAVELGADSVWRLTATPRAEATGDSAITLVADNGSQVGTVAFWLSVGRPARDPEDHAPAAKPSTTGLSIRRNSFRGLWDDLP